MEVALGEGDLDASLDEGVVDGDADGFAVVDIDNSARAKGGGVGFIDANPYGCRRSASYRFF